MPLRQRCQACHQSQKKCDRTRPKCGRCTSKALDCTYVDKQEHAFVNQNAYSADLSRRKATRPARKAVELQLGPLTPGSEDTADVLGLEAYQEKHHDISVTRISPGLIWELKDRVLARFLGRWTSGLTCLGRQDKIIRVHSEAKQTSPIGHAILAIAFADLAVTERHGDAAMQSWMAYHDTLQEVQNRVSRPELPTVTGDEFLTAILAIDAYEILYIRRPAPLGVHTSAIVELLRLRDLQVPSHAHVSALERIAAPRILARQLLCELPSLTRREGHKTMLGSHVLDKRIAKLVNDSCDLLHMLKDDTYKEEVCAAVGQTHVILVQDLLGMLIDMEQWLSSDGTILRLWRVGVSMLGRQHRPLAFHRPSTLVCGQIWAIRDWILYHMTRIKVYEAMIDENSPALPRAQTCLEEISSSCDFLLDTMPFLIGVVDVQGIATGQPLNDTGLLIAHYPLWLIEGCKYSSPDALYSAKVLLDYIQAQRSLHLQGRP